MVLPVDNDDFSLEHPVFDMAADGSLDQHGSSIKKIGDTYSPNLV